MNIDDKILMGRSNFITPIALEAHASDKFKWFSISSIFFGLSHTHMESA
jgi:hypothetical protein